MILADYGYNKLGIKEGFFNEPPPQILNTFGDSLPATIIDDGEMQATIKMVDGEMRSKEFETGVEGWQILPNGNVEFAAGKFRGEVTITGGIGGANLDDLGDVAVLDLIGSIDCDTTIISGGKIITGLLTASNIATGTLNANLVNVTNITADNITTGTLIGRVVKATGGSGIDTWLYNNGQILFRYANSTRAYCNVDTSGTMILRAYDNMYIVGDDDLTMGSNGNVLLWGDDITIGYDDDNNGKDLYFVAEAAGQITGKLTTDGDLNIHGTLSEHQYDFAEYFENKTKQIIAGGKSVVMDGGKVRPAEKGEIPFGVVSLTPAFIGNDGTVDAGEAWGGKYLRDEDMQYVMKEVVKVRYQLKAPPTSPEATKKVICYKGDKIPDNAENVEEYTKLEKVINPEYDENKKFKSRKDRPNEWSIIGLTGQILILKDQPINPTWIFMEEYNSKYDKYLVK